MRYSRLKIFHYPEKLESLQQNTDEILPPVHIRIKPTNACSHHCRYCSYRSPDLQLGSNMKIGQSIPRDRMLEIIDDIIDMQVRAITFSGGGDPFVYPHLPEAALRLAESPVKFAALTNGAKLTGKAAQLFANHATWLRVSLDGWDAASYARYRDVDESEFDRVLGNIQRFVDYGGPCLLGLSLIIDRDNAPHVYELIELAKRVGAGSVKVSPCVISDDGETANRYHEPFFDMVHDQITAAKQALASDAFEIYDAYHRQETVFTKTYRWCPYLQILPVIAADLGVYSCQDKAYNTACGLIGSIEHVRFKEFWMMNKAKFFAIDPARDCNHHCVADAKNRMILEYLDAGDDHVGFV